MTVSTNDNVDIKLTIDTINNSTMSTPRQRHNKSQSHTSHILNGPSELRYTNNDNTDDQPNQLTPLNATKHNNFNSFNSNSTQQQSTTSTKTILGIPYIYIKSLLYITLLFYLFIIPFILVQIYYIPFYLAIIVALISIIPTCVFFYYGIQRAISNDCITAYTYQQRCIQYISVVINQWQYELYQFILTCIGCSTYIYYTYHLSYNISPSTNLYRYSLSVPSITQFTACEYFLMCSLSIDYILHFVIAPHKLRFMCSWYSLFDLANFTGVAYFSFLHHDMSPSYEIYNVYLFQGPFRFLRTRRALKTLDKPQHIQQQQQQQHNVTDDTQCTNNNTTDELHELNTDALIRQHEQYYKLGPFYITKWHTRIILLVMKVLLYILSTAALILAIEFPCISLVDIGAKCSNELQQFHISVYFVVVTLATVGYGDIYAATDLGRMFMIVVIIGAVVQVPAELANFASVQQERTDIKKLQQARDKQINNTDDNSDNDSAVEAKHTIQHSILPNTHIDTNKIDNNTSDTPTIDTHAILHSNTDINKLTQLLVWSELQLLRTQSNDTINKLCSTLNLTYDENDNNAGLLINALFVKSNKHVENT